MEIFGICSSQRSKSPTRRLCAAWQLAVVLTSSRLLVGEGLAAAIATGRWAGGRILFLAEPVEG